MGKYPRVLIASPEGFNKLTGQGINLSNLFRGWPKDRIANVYNIDTVPLTYDICDSYFKLGKDEVSRDWPFSWAARLLGRSLSYRQVSESDCTKGQSSSPKHSGLLVPIIRRLMTASGATNLIWHYNVSNRLEQWIAAFQPEVIFATFVSLPWMRFVGELAGSTGIPLVIFQQDDWPGALDHLFHGRLLDPYLRRRMQREFIQVLRQASIGIGICESMCQAYEKRYGLPFVPFHNPLDIVQWSDDIRTDWGVHTPFRVIYAGSIRRLNQLSSLGDVCDVVHELHAEGLPIEMKIHTPSFFADVHRSKLERLPSVTFEKEPENETIAALFANADLLVLPVNFDQASRTRLRYSIPTKVPAYMLSGTPILAYGPAEVASIQYAKKSGWGYVVSRRDKAALKDAIVRLATDIDLRTRLGQRAQALASENHDARKVHVAFRNTLASAVDQA